MKKSKVPFFTKQFTVILFYVLLVSFSRSANCQDTIFSTPYPKGIVSTGLEKNDNVFFPINNPELKISVSSRETIKIHYANGKIFVNENYQPSDVVVLPTENTTGKIYYSGIFEFNGADKRKLFNAIKTLPQGIIRYSLVSSDENEFSFQKYVGSFLTKFQGDPYQVYFNLLVKFKDGKVKYEYSDFVAVFEKMSTKSNYNLFAGGINSTSVQKDHMKTLEQLYARGARNTDQKKFWSPIQTYMSQSVESIKKQCEQIGKDNW